MRNSENVIDRCTRKTDRQARKRIDRFARARTIDRDHSLHFHHALLFVSRKIKNDAIFHKHIFRILMQRDYDTLKFSCTRRVYEIVQFRIKLKFRESMKKIGRTNGTLSVQDKRLETVSSFL